jgi:hypothetical protein
MAKKLYARLRHQTTEAETHQSCSTTLRSLTPHGTRRGRLRLSYGFTLSSVLNQRYSTRYARSRAHRGKAHGTGSRDGLLLASYFDCHGFGA